MDYNSKVLFLVVMAPLFGLGRIAMGLYFGISLVALGFAFAKAFGHAPQFMDGHSAWWPIGAGLLAFVIGMYLRRLLRQTNELVDQAIAQ